jgi:K+-sensing histidine kinase KdpD
MPLSNALRESGLSPSFPSCGFAPYLVSVSITLLALSLTELFAPLTGTGTLFLFLIGVLISTWYGGRGPGLVSIMLSTLLIDFFVMPPRYSVFINDRGQFVRLVLYVLSCAMVAWLVWTRREALYRLEEHNARLKHEVEERTRAEHALHDLNADLDSKVRRRTAELVESEKALQELNAALREQTRQLSKGNDALTEKNELLEQFHDLVVDRELKMMALEAELNRMKDKTCRTLYGGSEKPDLTGSE